MSAPRGSTLLDGWLVVLAVAGVSCLLVSHQLFRTQMLTEERVALDRYVEGTAHRPFAFRVLMPGLMVVVDRAAPDSINAKLDRWGLDILAQGKGIWTGPGNKYPRAVVWLALLQWLCLLGYAQVASGLHAVLYPESRWRKLMPIIVLLPVILVSENGLAHVYDFSVLLFAAAMLRAIVDARHAVFLGVFALACLNKETAVLGAISWAAVYAGRMPWRRWLAFGAAQTAIYAFVAAVVRLRFGQNLGNDIEIRALEYPPWFLDGPFGHLTQFGLLAFLVSFRWREQPSVLRRASLALGPHAVLLLVGAAPGETRNLYESLPLLSMFALANLEKVGREWRASA